MAMAPNKKTSFGLKKKHLDVLQKHREYLLETLDIKELIDGILDNNIDILTKEQLKSIVLDMTKHPPEKCLEKFLDLLEMRKECNYKQFKKLLIKIGQKEVVKKLKTGCLKKFLPFGQTKDKKSSDQAENERSKKSVQSLPEENRNLLEEFEERQKAEVSPERYHRHAQHKEEEEVRYIRAQYEEIADESNVVVMQPQHKEGCLSRLLDSLKRVCTCFCCVSVDMRSIN